METEDEINPDTNAEADENLTEDAVEVDLEDDDLTELLGCLLYTSPSPRDVEESRMPSSA